MSKTAAAAAATNGKRGDKSTGRERGERGGGGGQGEKETKGRNRRERETERDGEREREREKETGGKDGRMREADEWEEARNPWPRCHAMDLTTFHQRRSRGYTRSQANL